MRVIATSNDPVRLSFLAALLADAGIGTIRARPPYQHHRGQHRGDSAPAGVAADDEAHARRVLSEAGELSGRWRPPTAISLGGRVSYAQPREGFRSGIEPVLLAAAIPARAGDRVLEGGTGAGAGAPLPRGAGAAGSRGWASSLIRRSPRWPARTHSRTAGRADASLPASVAGDARRAAVRPCLRQPALSRRPAGPPRPQPNRDRAKRASAGSVGCLGHSAGGTRCGSAARSTFILPASMLGACLAAHARGRLRAFRAVPLWPQAGRRGQAGSGPGDQGWPSASRLSGPCCIRIRRTGRRRVHPGRGSDFARRPAYIGASPRRHRRRPGRAQA